jgi:hypothetical protein
MRAPCRPFGGFRPGFEANFATLVGASMLARAAAGSPLAEEILAAAQKTLTTTAP